MRATIRLIHRQVESGRLPPHFRAAMVNEALGIRYAGTFLPKHCVGNPGGYTQLFVRLDRGLYRLNVAAKTGP